MDVEKLRQLAAEAGLWFDDLEVPTREETWPLVSLSGAEVDFKGPQRLGSGLATSEILLEGDGLGGWTSVPKGHGLWSMSPIDGALESVVSVERSTVAFVRLDQLPEDGAQHLLVWQGPWHDLFTFAYDDLGDAISALTVLSPIDSPRGVSFSLPKGVTILDETIVVSLDPFIVAISDRTTADVPSWSGTKGRHAEFFTVGAEDPNGVLALGEGAIGHIVPVDPLDSAPLEAFEQELVDQVLVAWRASDSGVGGPSE